MESSVGDKVDEPRNVAGVVASEMEGVVPANSDKASPLESNANSIEKADSDDDSFDIFATDNATPIPTQSNNSRKNAMLSKSNIEECDGDEGYYGNTKPPSAKSSLFPTTAKILRPVIVSWVSLAKESSPQS